MQVSLTNHKSIESTIKNLEVQVGQLAKQLAEKSSSTFGANTEQNPKEECKVVMTRGRKVTMEEEKKKEKMVEDDKQQLEIELALEPVQPFCELIEEEEEKKDEQMKETPIIVSENEENEKEKEKEKENEKNEKNEKEKERKEEKRKSKSECAREKKKEASSAEGREVRYPLVPSRKDKERHLA